jgi:MFS family permease
MITFIFLAAQELGTIMGILIVDRVGRRKMLIQSTIQSLVAMIILAGILAKYTDENTMIMAPLPSRAAIILVCNPPPPPLKLPSHPQL